MPACPVFTPHTCRDSSISGCFLSARLRVLLSVPSIWHSSALLSPDTLLQSAVSCVVALMSACLWPWFPALPPTHLVGFRQATFPSLVSVSSSVKWGSWTYSPKSSSRSSVLSVKRRQACLPHTFGEAGSLSFLALEPSACCPGGTSSSHPQPLGFPKSQGCDSIMKDFAVTVCSLGHLLSHLPVPCHCTAGGMFTAGSRLPSQARC